MAALFKSDGAELKKLNTFDQYLIFDSFTKNKESDISNGQFKWALSTSYIPPGSPGIKIRKQLTNISSIQAAEFAFPNIEDRKYEYTEDIPGRLFLEKNTSDASDTYSFHQFSHFGRFTISIVETGTQTIVGKNGAVHNFEYKTVNNSMPKSFETVSNFSYNFESLPIRDWDTFTTFPPIIEMNTITLNFKADDIPIKFKPDCFYDCKVHIDNHTCIKFFFDDHGLVNGDRIFVENFVSGNSILDSYVNRVEGHLVGGEPGYSTDVGDSPGDNHFWTNPSINVKNLTGVNMGMLLCTVMIEKRRLRIPMKFTCADPRYSS